VSSGGLVSAVTCFGSRGLVSGVTCFSSVVVWQKQNIASWAVTSVSLVSGVTCFSSVADAQHSIVGRDQCARRARKPQREC
jgi:hypothetical protein